MKENVNIGAFSIDGSLVLDVNEVVGELSLELLICLFHENIWIILLFLDDEVDVVLLEPLVLVLPDSLMFFVVVLLV